jgi:hypothetical protein
MNFSARICAAFLAVWTASLPGQTAAQQPDRDSSDVLVLDHHFSGLGEMVRVFLQEGQVYRAELAATDAVLDIRGVVRTTQLPQVYRFLLSQTPSGSTFLEIYPQKDAEYEIRLVVLAGNLLPARFRLYRDVGASARRQQVRANRSWEVGVELGGGWHSGFVQSGAVPTTGSRPEGGTDVEGCFTARTAGASSRVSACVLGVGHQSQHGARSILWVYTEPRLRILRLWGAGRSGWELGPLVRFGIGMISASRETPVLIAPGAYLARSITPGSKNGGWILQASYSRAFYRNFSRPEGVDPATPKGHRVSLGVGWYR